MFSLVGHAVTFGHDALLLKRAHIHDGATARCQHDHAVDWHGNREREDEQGS
jgi:hypothetical protein